MAETDDPIRSRQNPLLKRARAVSAGREPGVMLLEGERLILDAAASGCAFESVLIELRAAVPEELSDHPGLRRVIDGGLQGIGSLKHSPGALALAREPERASPARVADEPGGLWLCAAGLSDPTNLGAAARAAEAAGASGLIVARGGVHPFHPRAIRASMGSLLRLPVVEVESKGALDIEGVHHRFAATRGGVDFRRASWPRPLVLWMGDERGTPLLTPPKSAEPVSIPMAGRAESLNAATAAAILLFEAARA